MSNRFVLGLAVVLLIVEPVAADGCKFHPTGRLVPEREQRAFVEWSDGWETLHVAVRSDPSADAGLWVMPVRGPAERVRAEPVDEMPTVVRYDRLASAAGRTLTHWQRVSLAMSAGGCCVPILVAGCGAEGSSSSAVEVSRVERLGMVVTVVRAEDRGELERYFEAQGVNRAAADLSSLEPYFGSGHCFACGWVAARGEPVTATGLKLTFPTPTAWFPLRPTRVYSHLVPVVVFVRGHVRPAAGCELPGLRCEYVAGEVQTKPVGQAFTSDFDSTRYEDRQLEKLTRVSVDPDPAGWDRDLELEPGTTPAGTVANIVVRCEAIEPLLASAATGGLLGLALPLVVIPRASRRRSDYWSGAGVGVALVGTIWVSLFAFSIWRAERFPDRSRWFALWVPAVAIVHAGLIWAACSGLRVWIESAA